MLLSTPNPITIISIGIPASMLAIYIVGFMVGSFYHAITQQKETSKQADTWASLAMASFAVFVLYSLNLHWHYTRLNTISRGVSWIDALFFFVGFLVFRIFRRGFQGNTKQIF
jgi:hypothetical protein